MQLALAILLFIVLTSGIVFALWTMLKADPRPPVTREHRNALRDLNLTAGQRAMFRDIAVARPRNPNPYGTMTRNEIRQGYGINPYPARDRFADETWRRTGPNTIRTVRVQHHGRDAEILDFLNEIENKYMDEDFVDKKNLTDIKNIDETNYDID